uniref:Amino acid transporter transmembrane domain-containing protein n=2 Tax=Aegilops tauschii subsp. strangulata TaxID=200361 RepID=A0A453PFW4_AEGTS
MGGRGGDPQTGPLLEKLPEPSCSSSEPEEHPVKRTGTVWTASAHIITAVVGSGVLSLAWSVAQLGWVGGAAAIVFFAGVTVVQSSLLAECYVSRGHPERGGLIRNKSYMNAVRFYLGDVMITINCLLPLRPSLLVPSYFILNFDCKFNK